VKILIDGKFWAQAERDAALVTRLNRVAAHFHISRSALVRLAVVHYLDNHTDATRGESMTITERR
jgi:metal-responsive CopG/Arc/MetJ family transcriptional regulator